MTKLEILNSAMLKCGLPLAASLDDADYNALMVYDACLTEALRAYPWSFARRHAFLAQIEHQGKYGSRHAFQLPDDYLSFIDCRRDADQKAPKARDVERAGNILLVNINPCYLRYTGKISNVETLPPDFCEGVAALIAARIAALSAERLELVPQLLQFYNLQLSIAQAADAREGKSPLPSRNQFIAARNKSAS